MQWFVNYRDMFVVGNFSVNHIVLNRDIFSTIDNVVSMQLKFYLIAAPVVSLNRKMYALKV